MARIGRGVELLYSRIRCWTTCWPEAVGLAAILLLAAFLRFNDLQSRASWDSDQGTQMMVLWNVLRSGTLPLLGPLASMGTFHHGALFYYLMISGAWLGGGSPTWVLVEIALGGLTVVPIVWWVARSIAGPAAGLAAALLAATSGGLVAFSSVIWNPTAVEPGAALALLGAWMAWSTRKPAWLLAAAAGTAVAMQAQIAAGVLVLPMSGVLIALLWRGPSGQRRRIALWGAAGVALIVTTYIPFFCYEVSHNFAETRAIVAFITGPGQQATHGPAYRLALSGVRILAWPITGWPRWGEKPVLLLGIGAAGAFAAGLAWRLVVTALPRLREIRRPKSDDSDQLATPAGPTARERDGTWLVAACLGSMILVLGLGLSNTSEFGSNLAEQLHIAADPFVMVAAGIVLGSLWHLRGRRKWTQWPGRLLCIAVVAATVFNSAGQWPHGSCDSSWSVAQSAANRIEHDANSQSIALVGMPNDRSTDAYGFPLVFDGMTLVTPDRASVLVVLCDSSQSPACGGPMEDAWLRAQPNASSYELVDRFTAAPNRILSVYGQRST